MDNSLTLSRQSRGASDGAISALQLPADISTLRRDGALQIALEHPLVHEALTLLQEKLPANLAYHSYQHTIDVLERVIDLAVADQRSPRDIILLAIAAAWHDTGFIVQPIRNEPIGAQWAREAMERHGAFTAQEIHDVEVAILETQVKFNLQLKAPVQECSGRLSPWLLDADLANFGQPNFMQKSAQVYAEMVARSISSPTDFADEVGRNYVATTVRMLAAHHWHSRAANDKLSEQKKTNQLLLGHFFVELHGGTEVAIQNAWRALNNDIHAEA